MPEDSRLQTNFLTKTQFDQNLLQGNKSREDGSSEFKLSVNANATKPDLEVERIVERQTPSQGKDDEDAIGLLSLLDAKNRIPSNQLVTFLW